MSDQSQDEQQQQQQQQQQRINLDDIQVNSQDVALNLMAQFLELAQKRGAFSLQESAKIYESVKFFRPAQKNDDDSLENKKD